MSLLFNSLWQDRDRKKGGGGGGGKQQVQAKSGAVRLGSGMHSKSGRLPRIPIGPRTRVVIKSKFVKNNSDAVRHIGDHVDYISDRERGQHEKERSFFDDKRSDIGKVKIHEDMQRGKGKEVAMHKIIVSPSRNDVDLQKFGRDWMKEFERRLGYKIDWRGVVHENTKHHHIHFVVAGKIPEQENPFAKHLEGQDLKFSREDLELAREVANELYYRQRGLEKEWELNKEFEREFAPMLEKTWRETPRDLLGKEIPEKDIADVLPPEISDKQLEEAGFKDPLKEDAADLIGNPDEIDPQAVELIRDAQKLPVVKSTNDQDKQQPERETSEEPLSSIKANLKNEDREKEDHDESKQNVDHQIDEDRSEHVALNPFDRGDIDRAPEPEREEKEGRGDDDDRKGRRDDDEEGRGGR